MEKSKRRGGFTFAGYHLHRMVHWGAGSGTKMFALARGRYAARFAKDGTDLRAAQVLRWRSFIGRFGDGVVADHRDADAFDDLCQHVLVEETATGRLVCCYRILPLRNGADIGRSYSAQYYELSALHGYGGRMVEMGRFCLDPDAHDPDILRVAWGAMTRYVDENRVELLFGCSSFTGTAWQRYADAFALLADRHLAPPRWLPRIKAPRVVRYVRALAGRSGDPQKAMREMPPLLRSYLLMGGWVSDHAVIDPDLNTLHVFTGLEIRAIPPARARALRLVAG